MVNFAREFHDPRKDLDNANNKPPTSGEVKMLTRILVLGDSQVEQCLRQFGFGTILNDRFKGESDIVLRKFPGYTVEWIKLLIGCVCKNLGSTPDYVVVACGRGDCLRSNEDKRPVTDPERFRKQLYGLVDKITNEIDLKPESFILLSPFPTHQMKLESSNDHVLDGLTVDKAILKKYTEKTKEVAKRFGAQFVDTCAILDRGLDANFGKNGVKLTAEGHAVLAEKLLSLINVNKYPFPCYTDIGANYEQQLGDICKEFSLVEEENIVAYTHISVVDQYSAYMNKTRKGKV